MPEILKTKFIPLRENFKSDLPKNTEKIYVFDINETLYFGDTSVKKKRRALLIDYLVKMGYSDLQAYKKLESFSSLYGCIYKGMREELNIGEDKLVLLETSLNEIKEYVKEDTELRDLLIKLKGKKACLTNGRANQAKECLDQINILDCFDVIFHWDDTNENYVCKPKKEAYKAVECYFNAESNQITFFDNLDVHVNGAKCVGWNGILVSEECSVKKILKEIINQQ